MSAKPRDLGMTPLDDLFSTDESRAEAQLEKVVTLNPADISDFPNHPFKVKQDEAMAEMVDSVMPDIKTRDVVKGTVKVINKSAVAAERMKDAYVRTKDKAEHGVFAAGSSPEEYAADRTLTGTETAAHEAVHGLDKAGRKGVKTAKENISKAKDFFQRRKADLPKKRAKDAMRRVRRSADTTQKTIKTVDRSGKAIKQTAKSTGKAAVKTTQKTIKTAEQSARTTIKTTQAAAKAAQKTAQATAKAAKTARPPVQQQKRLRQASRQRSRLPLPPSNPSLPEQKH